VLLYSIEGKMRATVSFLLEQVRVPPEQLGSVLAKKPQLLGYSVARKLAPALAFLRHEIGAPWSRRACGSGRIRAGARLRQHVRRLGAQGLLPSRLASRAAARLDSRAALQCRSLPVCCASAPLHSRAARLGAFS
jgi:hypothetical protein